jgi:hypothetical protein
MDTSLGLALGTRPAGSPILPVITNGKIEYVGDSYIAGQGFPGGDGSSHRAYMSAKLAAAAITVDFVGPYASGPHVDNQHAGLSGTTLTAIDGSISAWLTTYVPDVCVVAAGLNDARTGASGATIDSRWAALLATMWTARPGMRVVTCLIPSATTDATVRGRIDAANALLPATFAASSFALAGRLLVADLRGCMPTASPTDAVDTVPHPTPRSFQRMGEALWPVVLNALGRSAEW